MSNERSELESNAHREETALARRGYPGRVTYMDDYVDGYGYESPYGYGYGEGYGEADSKETLRKLWRAVLKRKWIIITLTTIVTVIVAIEAYRVRPTFTATTMVEIKKDSTAFALPGNDPDPANTVSINTKILMFSSRPLLEDVIVDLKLDQDPRFVDVATKRSWWETVKRMARIERPQPPPAPAPVSEPPAALAAPKPNEPRSPFAENPKLDRYVSLLEGGMGVFPMRDTQALNISFTHTDPTVAATVANGLAQSFIEQNYQNRINKFANVSSWIDTSMRELKAKVQEAEQSLANYSRDNNIIGSQGENTLTSDKMMRLHDQSTRAEVDLLLKKSLYEEVVKGRVAQLPDAFTDPRMGELQKRLNDLSVQAAQLSVSYGPENPRVKEIQQQMAEIRGQLNTSRSSLEEKIRSDYERAFRDAQAMKAALATAKSEAMQQDQAFIQFNILKQNADTTRALYNEFLQKSNQANLETAQQQNNVSILRPARMPRRPDGLNRMLTILLGFLFSLAAGVGLAFVLEHFDNTVKNAGDVSRYAQLPTVGIIPALVQTKMRQLPKKKEKKKKNESTSLLEIDSTEKAPADSDRLFFRFLPSSNGAKKGNGSQDTDFEGLRSGHAIFLDNNSSVAEAYRALRTSILLSSAGSPPKSILVTSGQPGEGKTTTIINTAISLAQLGASVLIIDADLRKPAAHKSFSVSRRRGLSTVLSRDVDLDEVIQPLDIPNLFLLPCGPIPPNPAELIGSEKMKEVLRTLAGRYDHILIDSPPLMYVTDPVILSTLVDGVVLVVHGGKSRSDILRQSRLMLTNVGAKIFGVVLNKVNLRDQTYGDFAYYPYDSTYGAEKDEERVSDILG